MRIVEVTVTRSRKVSDGNYGSRNNFIAMKAEVETGDDLDAIVHDLQTRCDAALDATPPETVPQDRAPPAPPAPGLVTVQVTGATFNHKDALKALGLRWNGQRGDASAYQGKIKPARLPGLQNLPGINVHVEE